MITLNDNLAINVSIKALPDKPGYLNYRITAYPPGGSKYAIYDGRIFWSPNDGLTKKLYLKDILASLKDLSWYTFEHLTNDYELQYDEKGLSIGYDRFKYLLRFTIDPGPDSDILPSTPALLALVHPSTMTEDKIEFCLDIDAASCAILPLLSGIKIEDKFNEKGEAYRLVAPTLLPTIPMNYNIGRYPNTYFSLLAASNQLDGIQLDYGYINPKGEYESIKGRTELWSDGISATATPLEQLDILPAGTELMIRYNNNLPQLADGYDRYVKLAKIDTCDHQYYLIWFDRCGGVQILPFSKNNKMVSNYSNADIINELGEVQRLSVTVSNKITLNTDWLSEELLPYYEGMFVSPLVAVYDHKNHKTYRGTIDDKTFEFKTFKNNGRKMFNLQVNVALNPTEKIIY